MIISPIRQAAPGASSRSHYSRYFRWLVHVKYKFYMDAYVILNKFTDYTTKKCFKMAICGSFHTVEALDFESMAIIVHSTVESPRCVNQ